MPNSGAKIGWSHSSLTTSVDPSAVTPSPASEAPVARNEAQPSVVPACTIADSGMPRPTASALDLTNGGAGLQDDRQFCKIRAGSFDPVGPSGGDRVVAGLQRVVPVAAVEPAAQLAADPIGLVQHVANIRPILHHQNARQGGRGSPGCAVGGRIFRDSSDYGFVVARFVIHAGRPDRLSEPVHRQHRAGSAIDGERAYTAQVAR